MREPAEYKQIALDALRGKWKTAVLTGFAASLLGGNVVGSSGSSSGSNSGEDVGGWLKNSSLWPEIRPLAVIAIVLLLLWALLLLVIGGATRLGYAIFNLNLVDGEPASLPDLFSQYDRLGAGFVMNFLMGLYTTLWSLLLVIPGIIKAYSYAMTPYILAEHPELSANEAITQSRELMDGHKWRLFDLHLRFIGWGLLCALPLLAGVLLTAPSLIYYDNLSALWWLLPCFLLTLAGSLFLTPYQEAAQAAFYRDLAGKSENAPSAFPCSVIE